VSQQPVSDPQRSAIPASRRHRLVLAALLLCHALLVVHGAIEDSVTYDEIGNLAAGLGYLNDGLYGLYCVNPPLSKMLAAVPVALARPELEPIAFTYHPGHRPEWDVGDAFARANASRYHTLIVLGRLVGVAWSLLGALLIYRWAALLGGPNGGLLAAALWCFEPNVIAHAHLITPDVPAAVAALAAAYTYRRYLLAPAWRGALLAGLVLGIAELCKFTLVVLYPVWVLLGAAFAFVPGTPSTVGSRVGLTRRLGQLTLLFAASLAVLNLGYEGAGAFKPLKEYRFVSRTLAGRAADDSGNRFRGTWLGDLPVPLPEALVWGIDLQRRDFEWYATWPKFLAGQWSTEGWWHYYLYAAAVKMPLGFLVLLGLAVVWPRPGGRRVPWWEGALLWVPALALFGLVSSQRSLQYHFRYVLPALPFALVWAGRLGSVFAGTQRWPRVLVGVLLAQGIASVLWIHPQELAYFNEAAGGPDNGHNHLLGSNLDWGQDLFRLKRWLDEHPEARPIRAALVTHIDPRILGIEFELPPPGAAGEPPSSGEEALRLGPHPGWFAVSANLVRGYPAAPPDGQGGYRTVPFGTYHYFSDCRPVARAGHTIFLYHLTPEDANTVRLRCGLPPLPSDWRAGN
jgi:hypothetical protein